GDTGVDRVGITVPGSFGPGSVTDVEVDGVPVAFTDNTAGNDISVDLTTKVTTSSKITVLFSADAPTTQDLTGVDFLSTVDDSGNADTPTATTEGDGDGDAGDNNSWTVTTTSSGGVTAGLLSHWPLDETAGTNAADVGASHDGTYTNGVTLNQAGACSNSGTATYFGGEAAGQYVVVPHHDDYLLDSGTISLWANIDEFPNPGSDSQHGLFSKDSSGYDTGGHLTLRALSDGSIQTRMQSATTSYTIASAAAIPATTWAHIAFSWGTGGMKLYVDGGAPVTNSYTGGFGTTSGGSGNYEPISLGAAQINSGNLSVTPLNRFMKGYLDDVRIYDRALSDAEIQSLATCGGGGGGTCDVDGSGFYIEAENYEALVDGTGTFTTESSLALENGTGYLMSSGSDTSPPPGTDRVDYTVNFTAAGDYFIWTRGYGTSSGSDSVYVGLDGAYLGALNDSGQRNKWYWSNSVQTGTRMFNIATPGQHTINLWIREDSHAVDGIYITQDSGAIPGGNLVGIPDGATIIDPNNCGSGGGGSPVDHFAVIHDGNGINCQAEPITIEAHDSGHSVETGFNGTIKLSTTTSRGDWSVITGAGNLVNNGSGTGHYAMSPVDSGVVVLGLRDTFVETTNVNADHAIWSEDPGEDDDIAFARAGFNFLADASKNTIGLQIGGKPSN
ncbi:MAG: LamG-like jellyroll fold domain-containing protein, partial [Gemmatimonadales bacterium]